MVLLIDKCFHKSACNPLSYPIIKKLNSGDIKNNKIHFKIDTFKYQLKKFLTIFEDSKSSEISDYISPYISLVVKHNVSTLYFSLYAFTNDALY